MKIRIGELKTLIREAIKKHHFGGSYPDESYDKELLDDSSFAEDSVYVPNDIKKKIKKWAKDMGLSTSKK
jgi:hypothetical protein